VLFWDTNFTPERQRTDEVN